MCRSDRYWHIASYRCDTEFSRYRGIADVGQACTNQARFKSTRPGTLAALLTLRAPGQPCGGGAEREDASRDIGWLRGLQPDIRQRRPVLQRFRHHVLDRCLLLRQQRKPWRAGQGGAAAHDVLAKLDALDEVWAGIEVQ